LQSKLKAVNRIAINVKVSIEGVAGNIATIKPRLRRTTFIVCQGFQHGAGGCNNRSLPKTGSRK